LTCDYILLSQNHTKECACQYFSKSCFLGILMEKFGHRTPAFTNHLFYNSCAAGIRRCQIPSHIATDGQSVSKSWCRAPSGAHNHRFVTVLFLWGTISDERSGLSFVYAVVLASAVFLGSESLWTRDHMLLSQI
jgi:hypothetical protein